ncbi:MAG: ribonuclease HII [Deltaproteobacteria bacterium]|nr:ribonuclease HII [Deltaproteobacteria bacterium]
MHEPRRTIFVAGVDEAGRGPLAGPVTAATVVFRDGFKHREINDSKKLSEHVRSSLYEEIVKNALAYSVVSVGARRIEQLNIRNATELAMRLSSERVSRQLEKLFPEAALRLLLLIDGNMRIRTKHRQETIIKGDAKLQLIGAASILAKVTRDRLMEEIAGRYAAYRFEVHKGYPTPDHRKTVSEIGPCSVHRRTFAGVREYCGVAIEQRVSRSSASTFVARESSTARESSIVEDEGGTAQSGGSIS